MIYKDFGIGFLLYCCIKIVIKKIIDKDFDLMGRVKVWFLKEGLVG